MGVGLQEGYIVRHDGARNAYDQSLVTICSDIIQDAGVENAHCWISRAPAPIPKMKVA